MLRSLREGVKGTTGKILLAAIIVPFVFIGGMEILNDPNADSAMLVNGEPVSRNDLAQEMNQLRNEIIGQMGDQFQPDAISEERLLPLAKQRLLQRTLLNQAAADGGIVVSDRQINQTIITTPEFQIDGKFSSALLEQQLVNANMTDYDLRRAIADFHTTSQLQVGIARSGFSTLKEAALLREMISEQRTISWARLDVQELKESVQLSEEQISNFYESVKSEYMTELSLDVAYLTIELADYFEPVTEQAILEAYENDRNNFVAAESRNVAHILVEVTDDRSASKARARLQEVEQALIAGEDFAKLAREYSDDSGSASEGGELGFIEQDESFPEAFESAAFQTPVGEVSSIVETDSGLHLIKVLEVEREEYPSLEEKREFISQQLQRTSARKDFAAQKQVLGEETYNAENLQGPAEALGLALTVVEGVGREGLRTGSDDARDPEKQQIFSSQTLLNTLFDDELLEQDVNSDLIEITGDKVAVARVLASHPPRQQTLDEVREQIVGRLSLSEAQRELNARADAYAAEVDAGTEFEAALQGSDLDINVGVDLTRNSRELSRDFLKVVFALPRSEQGGKLQRFTAPAGDLFLYQLLAVDSSNSDLALTDELFLQQGAALEGQTALANFQANLSDKAEVVENL